MHFDFFILWYPGFGHATYAEGQRARVHSENYGADYAQDSDRRCNIRSKIHPKLFIRVPAS